MGIIGAYHEIPERFAAELPALQERASLLGIAGSDLPWCWIDRFKIRTEQGKPHFKSINQFLCPCCGEKVTLQRQDEPGNGFDFLYFIGLCNRCGTVWWH
jgi:hypothetical protein